MTPSTVTPSPATSSPAATRLLRASAGIGLLSLALVGCTPPAGDPAPTASASSSPAPSPSVSTSPSPAALVLPDDCEDLVPISWIKANFGAAIEVIPLGPSGGGPQAIDFMARGGIACWWGIPQSDAGFTLLIAERETATDADQIAAWQAAGYQLGPDFLDALWYEQGSMEVSDFTRTYALVSGYEIQTDGYGSDLDLYLSLIRQATDSMGYL